MGSMQLFEVKPGIRFDIKRLKEMLPTVEVMLFFAKLYQLDEEQRSNLLYTLKGERDVMTALLGEGHLHSHELQDYLVELGYEELIEHGLIDMVDEPPPGEVLPQLWQAAEIEVAKSIQDVADKLKGVIGAMPGKQGEMLFRSMMVMNNKRPTVGDHRAHIHHAPHPDNLVILDVSGSMTEHTIRTIVADVVALSYEADAHLAIVSSTATHWGPGEFSVDTVLAAAEYAGTQYETLAPLFDRDWGVVVTIADYDSSYAAKGAFKQVSGKVHTVLDISLVSCPTFLSEVIGTIADEVRPLLVAQDDSICMRNY